MRPPIPPRRYRPKGENDVRPAVIPGKASKPRPSVWADGSAAPEAGIEVFTAAQIAERMNASISPGAINEARRRQELVTVKIGHRFFYRLRDVEAWIAAQASIAEAATEEIIEDMRREARLKTRQIIANGYNDDSQPPMASIRVAEALLERGFTRGVAGGQQYAFGTMSVSVLGRKDEKKASCDISVDSGGRNNHSAWEMRNCREDVILTVIDALLAYLATEPVQEAIAETAARRGKRVARTVEDDVPGPS